MLLVEEVEDAVSMRLFKLSRDTKRKLEFRIYHNFMVIYTSSRFIPFLRESDTWFLGAPFDAPFSGFL